VSAAKPQTPGTLFREVWRIERQIRSDRSAYHRVGHDGWPSQELVRFRTSQHLGFAGRDVVQAEGHRKDDGYLASDLTVNTLGLTGARGALPAHYTELVLAQLKARAPALRDFLDLFNHRLLSLFYRSWEKTQPAVHQERNEEDPFSVILKALTGARADWEIYYGAAIGRGARSAAAVAAILKDLTGMPVEIRTLQGGWEALASEDQSQLPGPGLPGGRHARLGQAMLGSRVWIADQKAEIIFYPGDSEQLLSLLPNGSFSSAVAHIVRRLVGGQIQLKYKLVVAAFDLTGVRLGRQGSLGGNSFINARQRDGRKVEVSFKPSQGKE
jgi:type VI secretion system protein ImpH